MTDSERFLAAIVANPDDDTLRLVYADWLEERGDADRAEFIRLQITEAQTQMPGSPRSRELLERNRKRWLIPGIPGSQVFLRGFVEYLHISADDFLKHEAMIETAAPVVGLRLSVAAGRTSALVNVGWLSRLRSLDILNDGMGPRMREWFRPGAFPRLRSLSLRNNRLWADYLAILAELAPNLPALERLDLSGNPFGDEGFAHLTAAPALGSLRDLVLRSDDVDEEYAIGEEGIAAFNRSTSLVHLKSLNLASHRIGSAGFVRLVQSANIRELVRLDVSHNGIGDDREAWAEHLVQSSTLPELRELSLARTALDARAVQFLCAWDHLKTGCVVDLRGCPLQARDRDAIRRSKHATQFRWDEEST